MKKLFHVGMLFTLLLGMLSFSLPAYASTPQNYSVLVGSENTSIGATIMSFFPQSVQIHVGDSITWTSNAHEIHTVTFLAGQPVPSLIIPAPQGLASPLQINPLVAFPVFPANHLYDGSTYVNSGILSTDTGMGKTFSLTFTKVGVYPYICVVHGMMMSGTITVVGAAVAVASPTQVLAQGLAELKAAQQTVPLVMAKGNGQIVPPTKNSDGKLTHTIILGYESGNVMIMKFYHDFTAVHPGDTLVWKLSASSDAPHTVTFYNGAPDLSFVMVVITSTGPVALVNPAVLFPSTAVLQGKALNKTDFFNSGLLMPGGHTTFSLKVGSIPGSLPYECILHDTSGMTASLLVTP